MIKRKHQTLGDVDGSNTEAINRKGYEGEIIDSYVRGINGDVNKIRFDDEVEEAAEVHKGHFSHKHWARATTKTMVKVRDIDEPTMTLIDHFSEMNLMAKDLFNKGRCTIDIYHEWMVWGENNACRDFYGAYLNVKVTQEDIYDEHNFFVHESSTNPVLLGQSYITSMRRETKVMDDGSTYAIVKSTAGKCVR